MAATFADSYLMAVGNPDSSSNFRVDLYPDYKKSNSRVNSKNNLPPWFPDLKAELASFKDVVVCVGKEADDQLGIWSRQADEAGDPYVVCSVDKDLDAIAGMHFNNKQNELYEVDQAYSDYFFWKQVLMGDGVDNIPGLPGVGPVRAENLLSTGKSYDDYRALTVKAYKAKYGKLWWDYLITNARLLHIWRFENDHFILNKSDFP